MDTAVKISQNEVQLLNKQALKDFQALRSEEIAVFLPHCLKKKVLAEVKRLIKRYNFKKVYIVGGASRLLKILNEDKEIKAVVGIACSLEIMAAEQNLTLPKIRIKLSTEGCKQTEVSLTEFERWLVEINKNIINLSPL
jgi:hypothetical protein